jgi:hypothetical protein
VGAVSGPYHPDLNPFGEGNQVSNGVDFIPWALHSCVYNLPPNVPSNPFPTDGADNQPIDIILTWIGGDPDGDEVTYDVYFGIEEDPPLVSSRQTETSYDPGILSYETNYHWRIVAWDQLEATTQGPLWNFSTGIALPMEFNKIFPEDGATGVVISPTLSWEISGGASYYEYCIDTIINNDCDTSIWTDVYTNTSVELSGLNYLTPYEWQIRAVNDGGNTKANDGDWWEFATVIEKPDYFSKLTPPDDAIDISINPTLTWETSLRADHYEYCYDTINNDSCEGSWMSVEETSVIIDGLNNMTTYYWQIRAINEGGSTEANADGWWSFTTINNHRIFLPLMIK